MINLINLIENMKIKLTFLKTFFLIIPFFLLGFVSSAYAATPAEIGCPQTGAGKLCEPGFYMGGICVGNATVQSWYSTCQGQGKVLNCNSSTGACINTLTCPAGTYKVGGQCLDCPAGRIEYPKDSGNCVTPTKVIWDQALTTFFGRDDNADWLEFGGLWEKGAGTDIYYDDGNVGIGTTSPAEKLHVAGDIRLDAGGDIAFADDNTRIHESSDDLYFEADDDIYISPDDDIRMDGSTLFVDGSANRVGIGTAAPDYKLDVAGSVGVSDYIYHNGDSNTYSLFESDRVRYYVGGKWLFDARETTQDYVKLGDGGDVDINLNDDVFVRGSDGNVGIGTTSPGAKLDVNGDITAATTITSPQFCIGAACRSSWPSSPWERIDPMFWPNGVYFDGGLVGIGTQVPDNELDVKGGIRVKSGISNGQVFLEILPQYSPGEVQFKASHYGTGTLPSITFNIGNTEEVRIDPGGYVGIGTDSPDQKLHVSGGYIRDSGVEPKLFLEETDNSDKTWIMGVNDGEFWISENISSITNHRIQIEEGGNVGIGATNPNSKLHVNAPSGTPFRVQVNGSSRLTVGSNGGVTIGTYYDTPPSQGLYVYGNVGIGTTSPSAKLDVEVSSGGAATIGSSGNIASGNYSVAIGYENEATGNYSIAMGRNTSAGYVGTAMGDGTDASGYASTAMGWGSVASGSYSTAMGEHSIASGDWSTAIGAEIEAAGDWSFAIALADMNRDAGSTTSNTVTQSNTMAILGGKVGIGTTSPNFKLDVRGTIGNNATTYHSDIRWKKNIKTISTALDKVLKLRGVEFEWNKEKFKDMGFTGGRKIGLIAQEVEPVLPETVDTADDGYKSVRYANIVAVLIEAIKEQQEMIENLKLKIETLGTK